MLPCSVPAQCYSPEADCCLRCTVILRPAGLAKIQGGKVEAGWGTQFYMSPEAQRGDAVVTEKADVFRYSPRLRLYLLS